MYKGNRILAVIPVFNEKDKIGKVIKEIPYDLIDLALVFDGSDVVKQIQEATDEEIIEQASKTQVQVVRGHQKTLGDGHNLVMRMLSELDATTAHRGELEEMIKSTISPIRQKAALNAISLGGRAQVMRDLAIAAKTWVILERQA